MKRLALFSSVFFAGIVLLLAIAHPAAAAPIPVPNVNIGFNGSAAPQDAAVHLDEVASRLLAQGHALLMAGQIEEAIKPLQQATVVRPLEPGLYEVLANAMQAAGHWDEAGRQLNAIAHALEDAGAGVLGLATNTMHVVADAVRGGIEIPFIHLSFGIKCYEFLAARREGQHQTCQQSNMLFHDRLL